MSVSDNLTGAELVADKLGILCIQNRRAIMKHMKLITWNVNGIRAVHKKGLLVPFIESEQPDIICFQETKAQQHESPVDLPDYHEYWHSAQKKGYSGVAIFSKIEPVSIQLGFIDTVAKKYNLADSYGDTTTEGRVITAEFKDFYVVNVYTPNSKGDLSRLEMREKNWDPAFLDHCKLLEKKKPVVFCGDLNVAHTPDDLANPKSNERTHGFTAEERSGIDKIINNGFIDTFRMFTQGNGHYSWWSNFANSRARNIGWRIDYWFVSDKLKPKVKSCAILPQQMGSDHCPVVLELKK
jgi:exodeoxyribonuclease-3